jgi:N-acetylmuramoyl-L-alanine amidase
MAKPTIVTASALGLRFQNLFGPLGPEHDVTIHHTAGPKDTSLSHAKSLNRNYHAAHRAKGWGGIGYHYNITRKGVIICLRPTFLLGAHVGGHNTGNIGIMFHGTTGDKPTERQLESFRWLLSNANTRAMPAAHRTDRPLNKPHTNRRGHNDWPGHTWNACPGTHKTLLDLKL